jgi:hypothetical protein
VYFSNARFGTEEGFALGTGAGDDFLAAGGFFGTGVVAVCPKTTPVRSASKAAAERAKKGLLGIEGTSDGVGKPITIRVAASAPGSRG